MAAQKTFGLIGYPLSHSFSKKYFTDKFSNDFVFRNYSYENFELGTITEFADLINSRKDLYGLNVTIPYKESVIPLLDELNEVALACGAVNTIVINRNSSGAVIHTKGYNTDVSGFTSTIKPLLQHHHTGALVLGTGGASKAVCYGLKQLNLPFKVVSRKINSGMLAYTDLNSDLIQKYRVIINTTPVGTFPDISTYPDVPYQYLDKKNLLFDLVYNPAETQFLLKGRQQGAATSNGYQMLIHQAEDAFKIWENER